MVAAKIRPISSPILAKAINEPTSSQHGGTWASPFITNQALQNRHDQSGQISISIEVSQHTSINKLSAGIQPMAANGHHPSGRALAIKP